MAGLLIEFLRDNQSIQVVNFGEGTLDNAALAAAHGLKTFDAGLARILDEETGKELQAVVSDRAKAPRSKKGWRSRRRK